jgi:hypothetical protein
VLVKWTAPKKKLCEPFVSSVVCEGFVDLNGRRLAGGHPRQVVRDEVVLAWMYSHVREYGNKRSVK